MVSEPSELTNVSRPKVGRANRDQKKKTLPVEGAPARGAPEGKIDATIRLHFTARPINARAAGISFPADRDSDWSRLVFRAPGFVWNYAIETHYGAARPPLPTSSPQKGWD